jgi:hypothetical protein
MNQYNIDNSIDNINLQNENLYKIIKSGVIISPNIEELSNIVPQNQRLLYFRRLILDLKNNVKKCNKNTDINITDINITDKELDDIYLKQNGKCVFTKKDLTFSHKNKVQIKFLIFFFD